MDGLTTKLLPIHVISFGGVTLCISLIRVLHIYKIQLVSKIDSPKAYSHHTSSVFHKLVVLEVAFATFFNGRSTISGAYADTIPMKLQNVLCVFLSVMNDY